MHLYSQSDALLLVFMTLVAVSQGRTPPLNRRQSDSQPYGNSSTQFNVSSISALPSTTSLDKAVISTSLISTTNSPLPTSANPNETLSDTTSEIRAPTSSISTTGTSFTSTSISTPAGNAPLTSTFASSRPIDSSSSPLGVSRATPSSFNGNLTKLASISGSPLGSIRSGTSLSTSNLITSSAPTTTDHQGNSVNLTLLTSQSSTKSLKGPLTTSSSTCAFYLASCQSSNSTLKGSAMTSSSSKSQKSCTKRMRTITQYIATEVTTLTIAGNVSLPYNTILNSTAFASKKTATSSFNSSGTELPECPSANAVTPTPLTTSTSESELSESPATPVPSVTPSDETTTVLATSKQTVLRVVPDMSTPNYGPDPIGTPGPPPLQPLNQGTPQIDQTVNNSPQIQGQGDKLPEVVSTDQQQGNSRSGNPDATNGKQSPDNSPAQPIGTSSPSNEQLSSLGAIIAWAINGGGTNPTPNDQAGNEAKGDPANGLNPGLPTPAAAPVSNPDTSNQGSSQVGSGNTPGQISGSPIAADEQFRGLGSIIASVINGGLPESASNIQEGSNAQDSSDQDAPKAGSAAPGDLGSGSQQASDGKAPDDVPIVGQGQNPGEGVQGNNADPAPTITINGQSFEVRPSQLVAPGTTIPIPPTGLGGETPPFVVINGQNFQVNPSQLTSPETTIALPRPDSSNGSPLPQQQGAEALPMPLVVAGQTASVNADGAVAIGGQTVAAGASAITVGGTPLSLGPSGLVVGSNTILPAKIAEASAVATIAGQAVTPVPVGAGYVVAGSTITQGAPPITISGTPVSLGQELVVGSSTVQIPPKSVFNVAGQVITANPSGFMLAAAPSQLGSLGSLTLITAGAMTFSVGSGVAVVDGATIDLGSPTTKVLNGQTVNFGPGGIGLASTTIALPSAERFRAITAGGVTFGLGQSVAVIDGSSFNLATPTTKVLNGQTISIGPSGIGLASTTIPIQNPRTNPTPVTAGGITFGLSPSIAVVDGTTFTLNSNSPATIKTLANGQTISIGPSGIGFASTTIQIPNSKPTPTPVTAGGITFSLSPSLAIIDGTTFTVNPNSPATSKTLPNGQVISIGPSGIGFPTTTIPIPNPNAAITGILSSTTVNGIPLALGSSIAVINGTTFRIGAGATPSTAIINGQTISIGPNGLGFASTTIPIPSTPSLRSTTINGIPLALGSSIAVINGTTFRIGAGATPTTEIVNGKTISLGPGGVGLVNTTVGATLMSAPASATTTTTSESGGGSNSGAGGKSEVGWLGMALGLGLGLLGLL